jgi:hypothetical protein
MSPVSTNSTQPRRTRTRGTAEERREAVIGAAIAAFAEFAEFADESPSGTA